MLPQQIFALRAIIGGLAAFVTFLWKVCPCRNGTLRVLLSAFLSKEKQISGKAATALNGYLRVARLGTLDRIRIKHRPMAAAI